MSRVNKQQRWNLQSFWADYSWFIMLAAGLISLVLGYIGFDRYAAAQNQNQTVLDTIYLTLGLISMNTGAVEGTVNWQLQVARFMIPTVTAYTAFLAFTSIFIQQTDRVRLWFLNDHVVICGLGRKGFRLANQFLAKDYPVVIVEVDESNEWIENIRAAGAVVIQGDAGDSELLRKLRLGKAHSLIAVVGDDGKNAEIAVQAEYLSRSRSSGCLTCIIHISESRLWRLLREKELQAHNNPHFRLELFNIYNRGAHLIVQGTPPWEHRSGENPPRVLVVGLGKMGQRVVLEIARGWQLFSSNHQDKINLTLVDQDAGKKLDALLIQHPRMKELGTFTPLEMDIESAEFDRLGQRFQEASSCRLDLAYICLDEETFCLQTGLRLNHQLRKYQVPIVLRMVESGGLAMLIQNGADRAENFGNLRVFDLLDQTCTAELLEGGTHEILAHSLHNVYMENLRKRGITADDDPALLPWENLSEELKENNRQLADRIPLMLAETGYRIAPLTDWDTEQLQFEPDQVTLMARMEHESWLKGKIKNGWRYGPKKDVRKKTNPALLSWEDLPEQEKEKNREFIRGLPRLLARAGFQIDIHPEI